MIDENLYTKIEHDDGRIEFIPKQLQSDFIPRSDDYCWAVVSDGRVVYFKFFNDVQGKAYLAFHNVYPNKVLAEKAAEYMHRSNAIIRACLLVDPDFVPDWGDTAQRKYTVCYGNRKSSWIHDYTFSGDFGTCYVSTEEKAEQVISLLKKWGVK